MPRAGIQRWFLTTVGVRTGARLTGVATFGVLFTGCARAAAAVARAAAAAMADVRASSREGATGARSRFAPSVSATGRRPSSAEIAILVGGVMPSAFDEPAISSTMAPTDAHETRGPHPFLMSEAFPRRRRDTT